MKKSLILSRAEFCALAKSSGRLNMTVSKSGAEIFGSSASEEADDDDEV